MDRTARQGIGGDPSDEKHHLAKVRVAGSNPVFRSKVIRRGMLKGMIVKSLSRRQEQVARSAA